MDVFCERDNARVFRRARLVRHVKKRQGAGQPFAKKRDPGVAASPCRLPIVELPAGSVERAWRDDVSRTLPGSLVTPVAREVRPGKATDDGRQRVLVVRLHELDAMTVGKTMVGRVEVASVIQLRLIARVM